MVSRPNVLAPNLERNLEINQSRWIQALVRGNKQTLLKSGAVTMILGMDTQFWPISSYAPRGPHHQHQKTFGFQCPGWTVWRTTNSFHQQNQCHTLVMIIRAYTLNPSWHSGCCLLGWSTLWWCAIFTDKAGDAV